MKDVDCCLEIAEPWASTSQASLRLIEVLDADIADLKRQLRQLGADHPSIPQLVTCPGISWVLAFTIASEIGQIELFPTSRTLIGCTGALPTGVSDRRA